MIAAFVTPNHPEITKVVKKASAILGDWTGDPSLDAYQTNDPNRVRQQVAAVYAALQAQNITYVNIRRYTRPFSWIKSSTGFFDELQRSKYFLACFMSKSGKEISMGL
jgi:hypothetical protein